MKKTALCFFIFFLTLVFLPAASVSAQQSHFPIRELGNCRDQQECYFYCEIPHHKPSCWSYGKFVLPNVLGKSTTELENADDFDDLDKELSEIEEDIEINIDNQSEPDMEEKAKKYSITFPITELGNCANFKECKSYCERAENYDRCIAFAKKKGFYKEDPQKHVEVEAKFLQKAKEILGCTTKEECLRFCDNSENHGRCEQFARSLASQNIGTGYSPAVDKEKMLQLAQSELGCQALNECRQFCEQNMPRCQEFAKKHGFYREHREYREEKFEGRREGEYKKSCDNEESCRKYCEEHPQECPGFSAKTHTSPWPTISYQPPTWYPQGTYYPQPSYYPQSSYYPQPTYIYATGYPTYYQQPTSSYSYPTGYYQPTANSTYSSNTTY